MCAVPTTTDEQDPQAATGAVTFLTVRLNGEPIEKIHAFVPDEYGKNCLHVDGSGRGCERVPDHPRHLAAVQVDVVNFTYPITKKDAA